MGEPLETRLRGLVRASDWLMDALALVRDQSLPQWVVGAGVLRNLVWDHLHGYRTPTPLSDVDVAFFDLADLSADRDHAVEAELRRLRPAVPFEVTNQAGVHLWYEAAHGYPLEPLSSIAEAVACWPETATAVAVRLEPDDSLTVLAPCGLDDLFGLVLRHNRRQVSRADYLRRLADKRVRERWPRVQVVDDESDAG